MIGIIIGLIFILLVAGIGITMYIMMKKYDPKAQDKTENPNIKTAQEFLPFEDIRDDVLLLGQHRYRAILICSSTNYRLKTAGEKDQIELAFQRFLNTINFPITFYLQTKVIDNTARLQRIKEEATHTVHNFAGMASYAETYLEDMRTLNQKLGNNQQKKRYIIVSYDNADELNKLSEEEKDEYAIREVRRRAQVVQSNLDAVGVASQLMSTEELIELIYSSYWRDDYSYASELSDGNCFSMFVEGEQDKFKDMPKAKMLDLIFGETINKMELANIDRDAAGKAILEQLEEMRKKYAGAFKEY
jgi:hypothetical protein